MMERKDLDFSVVVTQHAKSGTADLYATMPWCARVPTGQYPCEAYSYGKKRKCKASATVLHVDVDGTLHYFCTPHLSDERLSKWHTVDWDSDQLKRVEKFFSKCVEYTEKAKASIAQWNRERSS